MNTVIGSKKRLQSQSSGTVLLMAVPLVGITPDVVDGRITLSPRYADAVCRAGGLPVVLPPSPDRASDYLEMCDAVILSGGSDVIMEDWGVATHPAANPISRLRQDFELAMLSAAESKPDVPVLAICLGMQLMGISHGARFSQHLADDLQTAGDHLDDNSIF